MWAAFQTHTTDKLTGTLFAVPNSAIKEEPRSDRDSSC